jgi:anti-anti-sigma regulatory factor
VTAPASVKHFCWSYDDAAARAAYVREYLGAGLAAGERVWYAAAGGPAGMPRWLAEAARPDPRAVRYVPLEVAYPSGDTVDPVAQVEAYASATGEAIADGFTGLRVFADATPLVRTPAQLDAFARYESLVDRFMAVAPMRAVCAYDRTELGDRSVATLACLHQATNATDVGFTLSADPAGGPGMILAGELDLATDERFPAALAHASLRPRDGEVLLDAAGLHFVDHRSLLHLQRHAERGGFTVVLRTRRASAARLAELVDLSRVRVEVVR